MKPPSESRWSRDAVVDVLQRAVEDDASDEPLLSDDDVREAAREMDLRPEAVEKALRVFRSTGHRDDRWILRMSPEDGTVAIKLLREELARLGFRRSGTSEGVERWAFADRFAATRPIGYAIWGYVREVELCSRGDCVEVVPKFHARPHARLWLTMAPFPLVFVSIVTLGFLLGKFLAVHVFMLVFTGAMTVVVARQVLRTRGRPLQAVVTELKSIVEAVRYETDLELSAKQAQVRSVRDCTHPSGQDSSARET